MGSGEGIPQTENSSGPAMRDVRDPEFLERDDAVTQEPPLTYTTGLGKQEIVSSTT